MNNVRQVVHNASPVSRNDDKLIISGYRTKMLSSRKTKRIVCEDIRFMGVNVDIATMDETTLLCTAIGSNPSIAALLRDNLPYIEQDKLAEALYYSAMGMENELLLLTHHKPLR